MTRRALLATGAAVGGCAADRPNILWITFEDCSPKLGCYGDPLARTPAIDALARTATRFTNAFVTAPVCSASRSCLITGVDPTRLGLHQHRSRIPAPAGIRGFPALLREAGYFTTNNAKTDYNVADQAGFIRDCWDLSSSKAHWRARPAGKPFFSVFNFEITHQSRTCAWPYAKFEEMIAAHLKAGERVRPADVGVPPYYPDTPVVRRTLAREYDCIAALDRSYIAPLLKQLEEDGLAENTVVFLFSDHGTGLPRGKRTLYDSGMKIPLLLRVPGRAGAVCDDLVQTIDLAPTVLRLAGVRPPAHMEGDSILEPGRRAIAFGARDRIDEAFDFSRSARDRRWLYIRNFHPHVPLSQPERYSREEEIRPELARAGGSFTRERPAEELYDCDADPHQTRNLASAGDGAVLRRMRRAVFDRMSRDYGLLPEEELFDATRRGPVTAQSIDLRAAREMAARIGDPAQLKAAAAGLVHRSAAVRFWSVVCLRVAVEKARFAREPLLAALGDAAQCVRLEASSTLAAMDRELPPRLLEVLASELSSSNLVGAARAARILWSLGERARPVEGVIRRALGGLAERESREPALAPYFYAVRSALADAVDRFNGERSS